jgi:hypothetical protein
LRVPAASVIPQATLPVRLPIAAPRRGSNLQTVAAEAEDVQQAELREYLMDHNYALADRGMATTLSSARFAAHTAEYRPENDAGGDAR